MKKLVPEFSKIGMLGCPISKEYGGLGYDILTYCKALERIGEEGNSMRTFFSVHTSIGQMVLQGWADGDQKKRYLPTTTSGKSIMALPNRARSRKRSFINEQSVRGHWRILFTNGNEALDWKWNYSQCDHNLCSGQDNRKDIRIYCRYEFIWRYKERNEEQNGSSYH